jgi:hypothetical protein
LEPTFSPEDLIEKTGTILSKVSPSVPPKKSEPATSPRTARRTEKKRPVFLLPAIGIGVFVVISGAGFLAYRQFTPVPEVSPSPVITPSVRVRPPVPEAGLKSQVPPPRNAAEASPPASSAPSTPPGQPSSLFSLRSPGPNRHGSPSTRSSWEPSRMRTGQRPWQRSSEKKDTMLLHSRE